VSNGVSSDALLHGAWYALEQAGRLLLSAVTLADADHWSTAAGIAMLAREEMGRSRLLRQLAEAVRSGRSMTPSEVQSACKKHPAKQKAAAVSTTMRSFKGTEIADLLQRRMSTEPGSAEWHVLDRQVGVVTDATAKRMPGDRDRLRMQAFYTDILPDGNGWQRPWEISKQTALDAIIDAINDYAPERDRLRDEVIFEDHPNMAHARATMIPQPVLPMVRWSPPV
jgi:AbiV family abortive infection protein